MDNNTLALHSCINKSISFSNEVIEKVLDYARQGLEGSLNTHRAYQADLQDFQLWCSENHQVDLPASPLTLATYMTYAADSLKWSSINRRLAAISKNHKLQNFDLYLHNFLRQRWSYLCIENKRSLN